MGNRKYFATSFCSICDLHLFRSMTSSSSFYVFSHVVLFLFELGGNLWISSGFIVALKCYPIELAPLVLLLLLLLLYVGAYISCEGNVMIHEIRLPMPSIAIVVVVQFKWWRYPPSRTPPFPGDSTTNPTWRFLEKYISLHPESTNKRTHTLRAEPVMGFISVPSISGIYLCHH